MCAVHAEQLPCEPDVELAAAVVGAAAAEQQTSAASLVPAAAAVAAAAEHAEDAAEVRTGVAGEQMAGWLTLDGCASNPVALLLHPLMLGELAGGPYAVLAMQHACEGWVLLVVPLDKQPLASVVPTAAVGQLKVWQAAAEAGAAGAVGAAEAVGREQASCGPTAERQLMLGLGSRT